MITPLNKYKYIQKWKQEHSDKMKEYRKRWRERHPEEQRESMRKYIMENPKKWKEYQRKYYEEHKKYYKEYNKEWARKNIEKIRRHSREWQKAHPEIKNLKYRIDHSMSELIMQALKGKKAGWTWETLVGYTVEDLMKHLESQFEPWMNWDNYGKWEIDHKKPRSLFHYTCPEDPEFKECWALENLQPLERNVNRRKNNHYLLDKI